MTAEEKREQARLRAQRWREENRDRHREYTREYKRKHAAQQYEKNREWAKANPELVREYHRQSRQRNPEGYRQNAERWRAKNPDFRKMACKTRRARRKGAGGRITVAEWNALVKRYGGICLRCRQPKKLTIDHVLPLIRGGQHVIDNAQPLCVSCNSWKHTKHIDYRVVS